MRREEFFRFLTNIKHSDFVQAISFWPREYCLISCISPHIISKNILEKNEGCNDFVKAISLKPGAECLYQVHHWMSFVSRRKMRIHMNFVNFLTKIMGQTLHKIPIWRFCIYSLERLILHPQYHHTSFLELFLTMKEDWPISYFWRKSSVDPFTENPLWRLCKKRCLYGLQRIGFMLIMYMYITKHHFKAYFVKKWGMRKFSIFFFFYHGNFAKTLCLWPEENCIVLPGLKASSSL